MDPVLQGRGDPLEGDGVLLFPDADFPTLGSVLEVAQVEVITVEGDDHGVFHHLA